MPRISVYRKVVQLHFKIVWPFIATNSLWVKPTDALDSSFIGIATLHVSGSLSAHHQEFIAVHRHWYILCSLMTVCYQEDWTAVPTCSWYQCRCTAESSWWWAERLPETCRVMIPIKLESSASVGFIHKVELLLCMLYIPYFPAHKTHLDFFVRNFSKK